ncbi:MAG: hypothetical protein KF752_00650 [Pirellulaceae bacterium]|nr:hypothetical protein [Pirellulaceae bacterium]
MNPAELQPFELMQRMASFFESHGIAYRVVGSMASMAYGEPRLTIDIDMVADLNAQHVPLLCATFAAPEYYLSESAVHDAITRHSQFNIIHPASGLKVDVFIPKESEFARNEALRVQRVRSAGEYDAWFGSPEDILLNKLVYFQLGGGVSEKHLRDIAGMMKLLRDNLDRSYITQWAAKLGVAEEWALVQKRVDEAKP